MKIETLKGQGRDGRDVLVISMTPKDRQWWIDNIPPPLPDEEVSLKALLESLRPPRRVVGYFEAP